MDKLEAALRVCRLLDGFQKEYEHNTRGCKMPGNDLYGDKLMAIVEEARASLGTVKEGAPGLLWTNRAGEVVPLRSDPLRETLRGSSAGEVGDPFATPEEAIEGALHDVVLDDFPVEQNRRMSKNCAASVVIYLESAGWSLTKLAQGSKAESSTPPEGLPEGVPTPSLSGKMRLDNQGLSTEELNRIDPIAPGFEEACEEVNRRGPEGEGSKSPSLSDDDVHLAEYRRITKGRKVIIAEPQVEAPKEGVPDWKNWIGPCGCTVDLSNWYCPKHQRESSNQGGKA